MNTIEILSYNHLQAIQEGKKAKRELYTEHVTRCYEIWKNKYERKVTKPIAKRLSNLLEIELDAVEENIKKAIDIAIVNHDFGKLTQIYQDYCYNKRKLGGFRHEIVSTYGILSLLKNSLNDNIYLYFVAAAIYLHHEAHILHMRSERLIALRTPTVDYFLSYMKRFRDKDFKLVDGAKEAFESTNNLIGLNAQLPSIDKDSVVKSIGTMINLVDGFPLASYLRLIIASILLPIIEVDREASRIGRN